MYQYIFMYIIYIYIYTYNQVYIRLEQMINTIRFGLILHKSNIIYYIYTIKN